MPVVLREVRPKELTSCAQIMAASDPWIKLGIDFKRCLASLRRPEVTVYVAVAGDEVVGLVSTMPQGFIWCGYIPTLVVQAAHQGQGIGRQLLQHAEQVLLAQSPNVFLCVSSFNTGAQRFYERCGYQRVGELPDFLVTGYSEYIYRRTTGPLPV